MNKTNNEVTIEATREPLAVEGFNPDQYIQYYADGRRYLPLAIQIAWFRKVYPNGKLDAGEPMLDLNREQDTYICTARIYSDKTDCEDAYLAKASARRSKTEELEQQSIDNPYTSVQSVALSRALHFAGFWCSLNDDDLTKPLVAQTEATEATEAPEKAENTSVEEKPEKKARGRRKTVTNETEADAAVKTETKTEVEAPKKADAPVETETKTEVDTPTETEVKTPAETEVEVPKETETVEEAAMTASDSQEKPEEPKAESDVSETPIEKAIEEAAKSAMTEEEVIARLEEIADAYEDEELGAEEKIEEAPVENEPTEEESEAAAPAETPADEKIAESAPIAEEKSVAETPAADEKPSEEEINEAFAMHVNMSYFNGTLKEMFESCEGESSDDFQNMFSWLLTSPMAENKKPKEVAAAKIIAKAFPKEWMNN